MPRSPFGRRAVRQRGYGLPLLSDSYKFIYSHETPLDPVSIAVIFSSIAFTRVNKIELCKEDTTAKTQLKQ